MKRVKPKKIAAIDLGTNSFHLIVAEASLTTGRFHILDREKEHVRLGSGASDMKLLAPAAIERALATLHRFSEIASSYSASTRAIATSAVREAQNSDEFIRRVEKETGIQIEVASGAEEGRLIHLGVLQVLPLYRKKIFLIDIGGGSSEFLIGRGRNISFDTSLKIGSVRLMHRFFPEGKIDPGSIEECRAFVRGSIAPIIRNVRGVSTDEAVGTSGTVLALARLIQKSTKVPGTRTLNGFRITREDLAHAIDLVLGADTAQARSELPGIDLHRAEILPAGALILEQVFSHLDLSSILVSEFAMREGIIRDTIEKSRARKPVPILTDIQQSSVAHTLERYQTDKKHSQHVAHLSLEIFDQTRDLHDLSSAERNYLEVAALLHEVGLHISHSQHHRHSYYLIRHSDIVGYTEREKEIIANIARYHRKSHPKEKHGGFGNLSAGDKTIVQKLAAILRIADGLDRPHASSVKSITIRHTKDAVLFNVHPRRSSKLDIELWGANLKMQLFEEVFSVSVRLAAVPA